jgi:hypothetical protein
LIRLWLTGVACILTLLFTNAGAPDEDFFIIPQRSLRFVNRTHQKIPNLHSYTLIFESRLNCQDAECHRFSGMSTSTSEVSGGPEQFQTLATRLPRLPHSGPLRMTFKVNGLCRDKSKCSVTLSYDEFVNATEPVNLSFDYDEVASDEQRKKLQKAEDQSFTEIERQTGKKRMNINANGEIVAKKDPWKKAEDDFRENRKRLLPMTYSEKTLSKLNLSPALCGKNLSRKIEKCETHACIAPVEPGKVAKAADFIVHGVNGAGNCAISVPGGKRFFVPFAELGYFWEAYGATYPHFAAEFSDRLGKDRAPASKDSALRQIQNRFSLNNATCILNFEYKNNTATRVSVDTASPAACRDKKVDLLYQLALKHLTTEYESFPIGE